VEIKVGIQYVNREVVVESDESSAEVEQAFATAVADSSVLTLTDNRGRKVMIPGDRIAYVELGEENARKVGFGSL
jgi:hypothetical protein